MFGPRNSLNLLPCNETFRLLLFFVLVSLHCYCPAAPLPVANLLSSAFIDSLCCTLLPPFAVFAHHPRPSTPVKMFARRAVHQGARSVYSLAARPALTQVPKTCLSTIPASTASSKRAFGWGALAGALALGVGLYQTSDVSFADSVPHYGIPGTRFERAFI